MKLFPTREHEFRLVNNEVESMNRLKRRTEKSKNLTTNFTDKSFRGILNGNEFKIISSSGKGALCIMDGKIIGKKGFVKVEIHKVFRILLSILYTFPFIGFFIFLATENENFYILVLVLIGQLLMIRYFFIELFFFISSRSCLNRLRDVLDFEW